MAITRAHDKAPLISSGRIYADKDGKILPAAEGDKIPTEAKTVVAEAGQPISAAVAAKYGLTADGEGAAATVSGSSPDKTEVIVGQGAGDMPPKEPGKPVETKPRGK